MVNIPHWPQISLWRVPRKTDLSTTFQLLEELGNPHKKLPPTIHIAGTNGKGSTLAMIKNIFTQSGYSTHSYTSPHLIEFNERIKLQGKAISDSHLRSVLERTKEAAEKLKIMPSFFEGITCAAFLAFSETPADVLFLETGLGGRLDCTNVLNGPILTIITSISIDHTEYLGSTLKEIATEKAGIIKKNVPCIIGPQTQEIYDILIGKCDEVCAPSFCFEYDFTCKKTSDGFKYRSKNIDIDMPYPSLNGDHQILNASMAVATTTLLNNQFKITKNQIAQGLLTTIWPGRLQLIKQERIANIVDNNIKIYIDGAHNDSGAICLSNWAKSNLDGPIYMILGMTNNRDVTSFCSHFKNIVTSGIAVTIESEPSSYSASVLSEKASNSGITFIESDSLIDAIKHIDRKNGQAPATIIVTGSLFLVSDFFKLDELIVSD
jgi:dihydrofolate synthase/folylpolyglutamate synthase